MLYGSQLDQHGRRLLLQQAQGRRRYEAASRGGLRYVHAPVLPIYKYYTYLAVALRRLCDAAHISPHRHYYLPTDPRSYPEATAIPHRDCTLATTPRRRQCPHRAAKPGAARRKREGRAARVATDAVTVAIAVALTGRWRARFACMSITRPAVIYGRSASGTDTLAETGQSLGTPGP